MNKIAIIDQEKRPRGLLSQNQFEVECMVKQRVTLEEIAIRYQTIKSNVSLFLKRHKISVVSADEYLEHYKDEILAFLEEENKNLEDIEGWLGITSWRIRKFLIDSGETKEDTTSHETVRGKLKKYKDDITYMITQNVPIYVIAERLSVTRSYLSRWLGENKIKTLTIQEYIGTYKEEIEELLKENREMEEISEWIGVKKSALKKFIDINQLSPLPPAYTRINRLENNKEKIYSMLKNKLPLNSITEEYKVNRQYLCAWILAQNDCIISHDRFVLQYLDDVIEILKDGIEL